MNPLSIANKTIDRLVGMMNGGRLATTPEPKIQTPPDPLAGRGGPQGWIAAYQAYLARPSQRREEMAFYDYLETELSDVPKALDAFATMACTGTLIGASRGSFSVAFDGQVPQELMEWVGHVSRVIQVGCYSLIRGMAQYGSYPAQLVLGKIGNKLGVSKINHLPPGTMYRKLDGGEQKYWEQKSEFNQTGGITFARWETPHFAIWSKPVNATRTQIYGTSILRPIGRLGLQLQSCIDAMVISRLSRASARYRFNFDISDIKGDQAAIVKRMQLYQKEFKDQRQVLDTGSFDSYRKAPVPDQDFFCPAGKDLAWGIDLVSGDPNVGNIKDVEYLTSSYLGALGVPPQYLGHGGSSGGRSNLSQVDINFARSARYLQLFASVGFEQVVAVHMLLGGWDPELYPFRIVPPQIGARDELLNAQIRLLQSQVLTNLVTAGMDPNANPRWVLGTLMNMGEEIEPLTDEELDALFTKLQTLTTVNKGSGTNRPDKAASAKESRTEMMEIVRNLRELIKLDSAVECTVHQSVDKPSIESLRDGIGRWASE